MGEEKEQDAPAIQVPALRPVGDLDGKTEEKCRDCGVYPPDHKGVCEGCLTYRDHTAT